MADGNEGQGAPVDPGRMTVTTGQGEGQSLTFDPKTGAATEGQETIAVEPVRGATGATGAAPPTGATGATGATTTETPETEAPEEVPDLGDYDGSDAATAKFDAHYLTGENQQLNREAIGREFWSRQKAAGADAKDHGHMSEGFYKWAEQTFQVDREFITDYEKGLSAQAKLAQSQGQGAEAQFIESAGGLATVTAAIEWGRGNYTPEQRKRYDELYAKGGQDRQDAVDALMARWGRAGSPGKPAGAAPERRVGRRSAPARDATAGAAAAAAGPVASGGQFKNEGEYAAALAGARKAARDAGTNTDRRKAEQQMEEIREKGRRGFSGA